MNDLVSFAVSSVIWAVLLALVAFLLKWLGLYNFYALGWAHWAIVAAAVAMSFAWPIKLEA